MTPATGYYIVALTRLLDGRRVYRQLVVPAYNAMMAEAVARALAPEAASAWVTLSCPATGYKTEEEARRQLRGEGWYSWLRF